MSPRARENYFLILGCNLGDRLSQLTEAKALLSKRAGKILKQSHIYETEPWGYPDQPWFLNQVIELSSELSPIELLKICQEIEIEAGRQPSEKWHARHMDIDILLWKDKSYQQGEFRIPHPQLQERNFVLVPLMEVAAETVHPILGKTIEELYFGSRDRGEVYIFNADEPGRTL